LGGEVAGGDRVDLDVVAGEVRGHAPGEHDDPALGGRVRRDGLPGQPGLDRTDVHHLARAALGHAAGDLLGDVERAGEVRRDDVVPVGRVEVVERGAALDPGVVDEDVRDAVLLDQRTHTGADGGGVGDVEGHGRDRAPVPGRGHLFLRAGEGRAVAA